MTEPEKKGLLAVSFGTSINEARERTIDVLEADMRSANPYRTLYRAWTSKMIIRKLKSRDGVQIPTVREAM